MTEVGQEAARRDEQLEAAAAEVVRLFNAPDKQEVDELARAAARRVLEAARAAAPVSLPAPPPTFGLQCKVCGVEFTGNANATWDEIHGWEFTSETGWLCPNHASRRVREYDAASGEPT